MINDLIKFFNSKNVKKNNISALSFVIENFNKIGDVSGVYGGYRIVFINNLFIVTTYGNTVAYSSDGVTWTKVYVDIGLYPVGGISYGNGIYIAAGYNGKISKSTDLINWSSTTFGGSIISNTRFLNGLFYATPESGSSAWSTNGTLWNVITGLYGIKALSVVLFNNIIYGIGEGVITTSTDGKTFDTLIASYANINSHSIVYNGAIYCGTSDGKIIKFNGTSVSVVYDSLSAYTHIRNPIVTPDNQLIFCASGDSVLLYSEDGASFSTKKIGNGFVSVRGIAYGTNKVVVVGTADLLATVSI